MSYMSYCSYCRIKRLYAKKVSSMYLPIHLAEIVSQYLVCDIVRTQIVDHYAVHA